MIGAPLAERDPDDLLSVEVGGLGWASVSTVEAVLRIHLAERVATVPAAQMTATFFALAALLDLG